MHPQHMQPSSVLHLPLVTAMTGQVKVSVLTLVLRHDKKRAWRIAGCAREYQAQNGCTEVAHSYCLHQKGCINKLNTSTWGAVLSGMKAMTPKHSKAAITHIDMCQHVRALKKGTCQHIAAVSNKKGRSGTPSELQG